MSKIDLPVCGQNDWPDPLLSKNWMANASDDLKKFVRPLTPEGRFEQRVSHVYGQLPRSSTITKDEVREVLKMKGEK